MKINKIFRDKFKQGVISLHAKGPDSSLALHGSLRITGSTSGYDPKSKKNLTQEIYKSRFFRDSFYFFMLNGRLKQNENWRPRH